MKGVAVLCLASILAACAGPVPTPVPSASASAPAHSQDQLSESVKSELTDAFGMTFAPAGPHHQIGRAPDGVELDLVGTPVEEVVLSLPSADVTAAIAAGHAYLPYLRELLGGPTSAWELTDRILDCLAMPGADCVASFKRGHLSVRFTDGGPDYIVLVIGVEP
ncbi:MAG: hypothetical protein ABIZ71_01255 [Gemmatimonadales bacterium]